MIKKIFLPEKIGSKRVLAQRIAGITVQDDIATLALVFCKQSSSVIEKLCSQKLTGNAEETYASKASNALKKLISQIKNYDQVRIAIPASIVTFKELQMPFIDPEKIRLVLDYELESMLPFPIQNAIVDFIITKTNLEQKTSQILVAAVQNQDLRAELNIYNQAGIEPNHITIDLFANYSLYQQIPDYAKIEKGSVLVDLGHTTTGIAFLQNGELRLTRTIPRGTKTIIKNISDELKVDAEKIEALINTTGLTSSGNDVYDKSIQKHFINFFNEVQFTLNSFSLKLNFYEDVSKIIFTDKSVQIKDLTNFSSNTLQIPCEIFDWKRVDEIKNVKNNIKDATITDDFVTAIGTAISSLQQSNFDLRRQEFMLIDHKLIKNQIITATAIFLVTSFIIGFKGYLQIQKLQDVLIKTEKKGISILKPIFPKNKFPKKETLQTYVQDAQKIVNEQTDLWAAFSKERLNPLDILLELTTIADKAHNDIDFTELSISTKEKGVVEVDVEGLFKSKRVGGSHYSDWAVIETRFKESPCFILKEDQIDTSWMEDKGIKFAIKLTLKEKEK
ncbi:MAG: General secretion pathway protein L [candidate division TM6 bacterium GW2011_GWF2_37_49]|nr:MAG: General secretion pathway protein L [candidate division TM6 bacterium GW2011_GWF2_37_49]